MKNPNTPQFWDKKIKSDQAVLLESPIYLEKCKIVLNEIKKQAGRTKLLDIGVGYGHIESLILKNKLHVDMYGIDITTISIKKIRSVYGDNFKLGNVMNIPFDKNFFDTALFLDVYEHLEYRKSAKALTEINRVLKKSGRLIISVPMNDSPKDAVKNGHLRKLDEDILTSELYKCGFRKVSSYKLFAYRTMFWFKNLLCRLFPLINDKPNQLIIVAKKI